MLSVMEFQITAADLVTVIQQKNPEVVEWAMLTLQNQQMATRLESLEDQPEEAEE